MAEQRTALQQGFWVRPRWDAEAQVFYSESNIAGLHIETTTVDEFHALAREIAPEMIQDNHPQHVSAPLRVELPERC